MAHIKRSIMRKAMMFCGGSLWGFCWLLRQGHRVTSSLQHPQWTLVLDFW
ncbi:Hyaluronan-binding protein 2 [Sesbania bispinosa]|nr:Hyaluronan-binding protein 2 [Sesbania bispinosa]